MREGGRVDGDGMRDGGVGFGTWTGWGIDSLAEVAVGVIRESA